MLTASALMLAAPAGMAFSPVGVAIAAPPINPGGGDSPGGVQDGLVIYADWI